MGYLERNLYVPNKVNALGAFLTLRLQVHMPYDIPWSSQELLLSQLGELWVMDVLLHYVMSRRGSV